jgi:hypothetical protein
MHFVPIFTLKNFTQFSLLFHIYALILMLWVNNISYIQHKTELFCIVTTINMENVEKEILILSSVPHQATYTRPQTLKHCCLWKESRPLTLSPHVFHFLTFWAFSFRESVFIIVTLNFHMLISNLLYVNYILYIYPYFIITKK